MTPTFTNKSTGETTMNKKNTINLPSKKGKYYYIVTVVDGCIEKVTEKRAVKRDIATGRFTGTKVGYRRICTCPVCGTQLEF